MNDTAELDRRTQTVNLALRDREPMITAQEIAEILDISRDAAYRTMWKWQESGIVKYVENVNGYGNWYWIGVKHE